MSVPTALLVITAALSAMMLAIVWSLRRCGLPGVADCCHANLNVTIALALFALRGQISDMLSIVLANAALCWALAMFHAGCVRYTISGGVASLRPGETLAQLSARADAALYRAKLEGRNRIVAHDDGQPGTGAATPSREALPA